MKFYVVTLFPEVIDAYMSTSIMGRAQKSRKIQVKAVQLRDFARDKHRTVDGRPYGGGPGMVLKPEPLQRSLDTQLRTIGRRKTVSRPKVLIMSAGGKQFTNKIADDYIRKYSDLIIVSGRYEGVDARIKKMYRAEEISIGPYVLTGGEVPAMVVMDTITRRIPGVLGKDVSVEERRVSSSEVYTRPDVVEHNGKKYRVPKTLLSGHHANIDGWRKDSDKK